MSLSVMIFVAERLPFFCLQQVPGGCGGGAPPQAEERHRRDPALLPGAHSLPERHAAQLPVLLQRRAAHERAEGARALLCRWVMEPPASLLKFDLC